MKHKAPPLAVREASENEEGEDSEEAEHPDRPPSPRKPNEFFLNFEPGGAITASAPTECAAIRLFLLGVQEAQRREGLNSPNNREIS